MLKIISTLLLTLISLSMVACGNSSIDPESNAIKLPGKWQKYLVQDSLSATFKVYDSKLTEVFQGDLTLDLKQGLVSSPKFLLPTNQKYRFVIIFHYQYEENLLALAYVDKELLLGSENATLNFGSNEIIYGKNSSNLNLSQDISTGVLPNMDEDGDGWSNYDELRDQVNPFAKSSIPQEPTLKIESQISGHYALITLTATDNAHVEILDLLDPLCGVDEIGSIKETKLENGDIQKIRTYRLNLASVSSKLDFRALQAWVDDGVTSHPASQKNLALSQISMNLSQPDFVFTSPTPGSELEGTVSLQGIACARDNLVNEFNLTVGDNLISLDDLEFSEPNINAEKIITVHNLNSTLFPDIVLNFIGTVYDESNHSGQGQTQYNVVNDHLIKVVQPAGRRWLHGKEDSLVFSTVNLPNTTVLTVDPVAGVKITSLGGGDSSGKYKIDVSGYLDQVEEIPITISATQSDGTIEKRTINFTVRNLPQITKFDLGSSVYIPGWMTQTKILYKIINVNPDTITINNKDVDLSCEDSQTIPGIKVCEGTWESAEFLESKNFELRASSLFENLETCQDKACFYAHKEKVASELNLLKDIPDFVVCSRIYGKVVPPELQFNNEDHAYFSRIEIESIDDNQTVYSNDDFAAQLTLGGFFPEQDSELTENCSQDYRVKLQTLDTQGHLIGELTKEFSTSDPINDEFLLAWYKFDEKDVGCGLDICNSIDGHDGVLYNDGTWINNSAEFHNGALRLNGINQYIKLNNANSALNPRDLTLILKVKINNVHGNPRYHALIDLSTGAGYQYWAHINRGKLNFRRSPDDFLDDVVRVWLNDIENDTNLVVGTSYGDGLGGQRKIALQYIDENNFHHIRSHQIEGEVFNTVANPSGDDVSIGRSQSDTSGNSYAEGVFDELLIFDKAYSDEELSQLIELFKIDQ